MCNINLASFDNAEKDIREQITQLQELSGWLAVDDFQGIGQECYQNHIHNIILNLDKAINILQQDKASLETYLKEHDGKRPFKQNTAWQQSNL